MKSVDAIASHPLRVIEELVRLGRGVGEVRVEIAAIANRIAARTNDPLLIALATTLQPPAERERRAREQLAASTDPLVIGAWIAGLPEAEHAAAIAPHVVRAMADGSRWDTLRDLVHHLPDATARAILRDCFRLRATEADFDASEVYHLRGWDPDELRTAIASELAAPTLYAAWRLGDWARDLPADERDTVVDHALDAFERIVATPTYPGNDPGPFCELASLLDAPRVLRALAIVDRMERAAAWAELDVSRSSLASRLAELGSSIEADAIAAAIGDQAERAWARGAIAGHRIERGEPWRAPEPEDVANFLYGLVSVCDAPPAADVVAACRAIAATARDIGEASQILDDQWATPAEPAVPPAPDDDEALEIARALEARSLARGAGRSS